MNSAPIAAVLALLCSGLVSQDAQAPRLDESLANREFLEKMILSVNPEAWRGLRMSVLTQVPSEKRAQAKHVETQCTVRMMRGKEPMPLMGNFFKAMVHNIERGGKGTSPWRLRRASIQRHLNSKDQWTVGEMVFGFRRALADGSGPLQGVGGGLEIVGPVLDLLNANETEHVRTRAVMIDLTKKVPVVLAQIRASGKDYKKHFLAVETKLAKRDKKAKTILGDVRWRGDEKLQPDKISADFTLDFRVLRKQPAAKKPAAKKPAAKKAAAK